MALIDRDYMRETPRTHVGDPQRPDLSWVNGSPQRGQHTTAWAVLGVLLVVALVVATLIVSGAVTFTIAR